MIFPRGPFHLIGHAQLIPCVDPEHEALLISRLAEPVCVCFVCGMGGAPQENTVAVAAAAAAAWQHRGSAAWQGQTKDAGECCRMSAGSWSEGRAAEGEQKIAQPRETQAHK